MMLGQLCAAQWDSQSQPVVIQPGFKPGAVVTPLELRCGALDCCTTCEPNLPTFHQHVNQREIILDHLYSTHRDAYKALPRPPFGKSDHNYILLTPAYMQKLKQDVPVTRKWSDYVDATLQHCFASTDWNMFRDLSNGTSVTGFINKCTDDVVPTVTIRTFPNQKPWTTSTLS